MIGPEDRAPLMARWLACRQATESCGLRLEQLVAGHSIRKQHMDREGLKTILKS
jgi:hypothetical protein